MATKRSPLWGLATLVLLIMALAIAISHGRVIDAVVIGILAIPALAVVVTTAISRMP